MIRLGDHLSQLAPQLANIHSSWESHCQGRSPRTIRVFKGILEQFYKGSIVGFYNVGALIIGNRVLGPIIL